MRGSVAKEINRFCGATGKSSAQRRQLKRLWHGQSHVARRKMRDGVCEGIRLMKRRVDEARQVQEQAEADSLLRRKR